VLEILYEKYIKKVEKYNTRTYVNERYEKLLSAKMLFIEVTESHKKDGRYAKLILDYILIPDLSNIVHQYAYS
jgi:hypothetical protein